MSTSATFRSVFEVPGKRPSGDNIMPPHECPHRESVEVLAEKVERMNTKMTMLWGPNGSSEPARNSIIATMQKAIEDNSKLVIRLFVVAIVVEALNLLGGNANGLVRIIQALR